MQIFKPRLDNRYSEDHIVSHSEMKIKSQLVEKANEILGAQLNTIHNIHYYLELMNEMRTALEAENFSEFTEEFHKNRGIGVLNTTG